MDCQNVQAAAGKSWSEPIQALHDRLKEQEVNSQWIEQLIEQIEEQLDNNKDEAITRQAVWDMARLILLDWMKGFEGEGNAKARRSCILLAQRV